MLSRGYRVTGRNCRGGFSGEEPRGSGIVLMAGSRSEREASFVLCLCFVLMYVSFGDDAVHLIDFNLQTTTAEALLYERVLCHVVAGRKA